MSLPSTDVHPVPVRTELTSPRSSEGMTAVIRVCGTRMATETRGGTRRGWRGAGSEPRGPGGQGRSGGRGGGAEGLRCCFVESHAPADSLTRPGYTDGSLWSEADSVCVRRSPRCSSPRAKQPVAACVRADTRVCATCTRSLGGIKSVSGRCQSVRIYKTRVSRAFLFFVFVFARMKQ